MNGLLIAAVIAVALAVFWLVLRNLQGRQKNEVVESQMNELRRDLQTIATSQAKTTGQLETIAKSVAQRLDSFTPTLQEAIKNSAQITGQLASDAQARMAGELQNAREQISEIQRQLGGVQQASAQLSQAAQTIEGILGGAKSRGSLGEVAGEAATLDPENISDLAVQLKRLATDQDFRASLRAAGLKRAQTFDWQRTAVQTLELYALAHSEAGSREAKEAHSAVCAAQPSAPMPMN